MEKDRDKSKQHIPISNVLEKVLDQLKEEIEPLIKGKSNYEIMQEMNKIILDKYQFGSNFKNYSGVNNSFINY